MNVFSNEFIMTYLEFPSIPGDLKTKKSIALNRILSEILYQTRGHPSNQPTAKSLKTNIELHKQVRGRISFE